jgi:hypothetical protein
MNITLTGVVLFLHITAAIVAFAMAGVVHAALPAVARAKTVVEMRPWAAVLHRLDPLFPLVALVLLGLGAWLVHLGAHTDDQFSFSDGWILTAIVTLVVIEATAGALLAPQAKRLVRMVHDHDDGPPSDEIRAVATDARIWHAGHVATFGFLGVVFLMAVKPTGAIVVVPPLVGAALGLVLSTLQLRRLRVGGPATLPRQREVAEEPSAANA